MNFIKALFTKQDDHSVITRRYKEEWKANPEKRAEISWRYHHYEVYILDGYNPADADAYAQELDYGLWQEVAEKATKKA